MNIIAIARQSLEMALFKTYSVPSISRILAATSQFSSETGKRVEDTELILVCRNIHRLRTNIVASV